MIVSVHASVNLFVKLPLSPGMSGFIAKSDEISKFLNIYIALLEDVILAII